MVKKNTTTVLPDCGGLQRDIKGRSAVSHTQISVSTTQKSSRGNFITSAKNIASLVASQLGSFARSQVYAYKFAT